MYSLNKVPKLAAAVTARNGLLPRGEKLLDFNSICFFCTVMNSYLNSCFQKRNFTLWFDRNALENNLSASSESGPLASELC